MQALRDEDRSRERVARRPDRDGRDDHQLRYASLCPDVVAERQVAGDLVPVEPSRVTKFIQDHGADRALRVDEITADVLAAMK